MRCKIPKKDVPCNGIIHMFQEGNGKYDVFRCAVHGLITPNKHHESLTVEEIFETIIFFQVQFFV